MENPNLHQAYRSSVKDCIWNLIKQLDITPGEGEYFEDADLIAIIRRCPILFNKKLLDYKNEVKKDFFWDSIAEIFGTDNSHVKDQPEREVDFIESVKKRPELYSRRRLIEETLKPGEDIEAKIKNCWIEVARESGSSVEYCQRRWQSMRTLYLRTRKGRHRGSNKSFSLYENLQFLDQYVTPRRRFISKKIEKNFAEVSDRLYPNVQLSKAEFIDSNQVKAEELDMQESMILSDSNSDSDSFSNSSSYNETTGQDSNSITSNANSRAFINGASQLDDEDGNFGKAIAADLRNIPSGKKKLLLKASIYKLLYEAMEDG